MAIAIEDYEDEFGNIDYDTYYSDLYDYEEMRYEQLRDDSILENYEENK